MDKFIKSAIILILFFSNTLFAETVTLKSGKKVEGKILEKTDQYIKIEADGSPLYYELKYLKSIEEDKKDANFYFKTGLKYGSEAKFKEAEREFRKGLEINASGHNLQEALKMIDDLKNGTINQDYALYLFKGSNYLINAQYKEAITEFKEALKFKPDDSDLYYYLGISYYSLGQYSEAINCLQKTLEINPDDAEAHSILGASNYSLGQLQPAKENLYKAKELFQNKGDYLKAKEIEDFLTKLN